MSYVPARLVSVPAPFPQQCNHLDERRNRCGEIGTRIIISNERRGEGFVGATMYEVQWFCESHDEKRLV